MDKTKDKQNVHKLLDEQIIKSAANAALKTKGVAELSLDHLSFGKKKDDPSKAIKVTWEGAKLTLDVYLAVNYEVCIPEIAFNIQKNVQTAVESIEGINIKTVNIHIEKIKFPEEGEN